MSNLAEALNRAFISITGDLRRAEAVLRFSPGDFFFEGHFPGAPVLPAFVQIAAALELASRLLAAPQRLAEVTRAKFTSPAGPGRALRLAATLESESRGRHKVRAGITDGDTLVCELVLRVEPQGPRA